MAAKKLYQDTNLRIIFSITLIAVMGVSGITPAFPQIQEALGIPGKNIGLLITAFTIPGIVLTPVLGVMADWWGRKSILVPSLFLFGIAGSACFFAENFTVLLVLRFLQGMGAASLGALNLTLIGDLFSGHDRSAAMGYNSSVLSIGTAGYPAIGGALALFGWYFPFALNILALPVGLVVIFKLNNPEPKNQSSLKEYLGNTYKSVKQLQVLILFTISLVTFIILYGTFLTFFPFLADHNFNASSFEIGILMSGASLFTALISSQVGKLTRLLSEKKLLVLAFILYPIALLIIPFINHLWLLLLPVAIFGIAQGINLPSFMSLLTSFAPLEHRAAFMSINGMVLRGGQTLGPLLMGVVFDAMGIYYVFYLGATFALLMMILIVLFLAK